MKHLVRFAVIRFMPFAQTQEFANVGIVAYAPESGEVRYKLAAKRFSRVSNFFDDLDGKLYTSAINLFEYELERIQNVALGLKGSSLADFMSEVTRTREGFLVYSDTASLLSHDDIDVTLEKLFDKLVGRNFNTKEHREQLLVRELKQELNAYSRYKFKSAKINTQNISVEFPLVATDQKETKAIKPMSFNQKTTLKLFDHGEFWMARVKHLLNENAIEPDNFLFAVEEPETNATKFISTFRTIRSQMEDLGVKVFNANDSKKIKQFARFDSEHIEHFTLV
ncbi:DUF3037 domain-containing protein [Vibrio coralliilyticus]|uniref:DUF3037 domain-containing protein n=1 Tax=Vibrio coralliilyticus TaxID=190893 RepID=UPI00148C3D36|nr:DUF3037 domain-containing protein [Vibrio coralliilyticus]NOI30513.1 DUF3037 domain-containing protein [Vibrio coralliilyticus]NOI50101.1 DUF3037 domain-containing protein [Vibrio coralliilyticus]